MRRKGQRGQGVGRVYLQGGDTGREEKGREGAGEGSLEVAGIDLERGEVGEERGDGGHGRVLGQRQERVVAVQESSVAWGGDRRVPRGQESAQGTAQ